MLLRGEVLQLEPAVPALQVLEVRIVSLRT